MRNKELNKSYHNKPCVVCGITPCDPDHIKNMGSRPERDVEKNLWPLCRIHHSAKHAMGLKRFVEKHQLWEELKSRGFYWDDVNNKYRHEEF